MGLQKCSPEENLGLSFSGVKCLQCQNKSPRLTVENAVHFDCCDPQRLHISSFIGFLLIEKDHVTFSTVNCTS